MSNVHIKLLKSNRFLPMLITQFVSAINTNILRAYFVYLVVHHNVSTPTFHQHFWESMITASLMTPFFLFSALGGQLSDKYPKFRVLQWVKLFEIPITVSMIITFFLFNGSVPWLVCLCIFLLGSQQAIMSPAKYSILPEYLYRDELLAGNALIETTTFIAIILGAAIGGFMHDLFPSIHHSHIVVSIITLSLAITGYLTALLIPPKKSAAPQTKIKLNVFKATQRNLDETSQQHHLWKIILGISWLWFIGTLVQSQFRIFVELELHASFSCFAFLNVAFTIGIAAGSMVCSSLLKNALDSRYAPLSLIIMTFFGIHLYLGVPSAESLPTQVYSLGEFLVVWNHWRVVLDVFCIAFCGGVFVVPLYAILQRITKKRNRSQVLACNNMVNSLFMVLSTLTTMFFVTSLGWNISTLFLFAMISNLFVAFYLLRILPFNFIKAVGRGVLRFFFHVEVIGIDHFKKAGKNVIIIANHSSMMDVLLLACFLPGRFNFAIHPVIAEWRLVKMCNRLAKVFPVETDNPIRMKTLIKLLRSGERCIVFPEGRVSTTGRLMKIYDGTAMVAHKAQSSILPIYIEGAYSSKFSHSGNIVPKRWFPKITLHIFPSEKHLPPEGLTHSQQRSYLSRKLYETMTKMVFEAHSKQNLFLELKKASVLYGRKKPIIFDPSWSYLTYRSLILKSIGLGRIFKKRIHGHDRFIGVMLPNTMAHVVTLFGLLSINKTPTMLNFSTGISQIKSACQTAKLKTVITARAFIEKGELEHLIEALESEVDQIIYLEDLKKDINLVTKIKSLYHYTRFAHSFRPERLNAPTKPAFILFTSGSEGAPKGVVLSHKNIMANARQLQAVFSIQADDVLFNPLPMFHSFGLTAGTLFPILTGSKVFFYPNPKHYTMISNYIYESEASALIATNTFLSGYAKATKNPFTLTRLRCAIAGGEKLNPNTRHEWFERFGVPIFEGYGVTECSPVISGNTHYFSKHGSIGKILPGLEVNMIPFQNIPDAGELCIKGASVMLGYMKHEQPGVIIPPKNGWHHTGDIVKVDSEGFYSVVDRVKRFAKIGGEMISLTATEAIINIIDPDNRHALMSTTHDKKGESLTLFTTSDTLTRKELIKKMKDHGVTSLSCPSKVVYMKEIPTLSTGKVNYPELKKDMQLEEDNE